MVGYEKLKTAFDEIGVGIFAASVDAQDKAQEVAADLSYPVAWGVTRADAVALGSWWEDRRGIVQPSEFIVRADGTIVGSTYSSGPVGRMAADDALSLIKFLKSRES